MRLNGIHAKAQDSNEVLISSHLIKSSKLIQDHSPGLSAWMLNKAIDLNHIEVKKDRNIEEEEEEEKDKKRKLRIKCEECGLERLKRRWIGKEMKLLIVCDYCDDRNWKSISKKQKQEITSNQFTNQESNGLGNGNGNGNGNGQQVVLSKTSTQSNPKPKKKKNPKNSQLSQMLKLHQNQNQSSSSFNKFNLNQFLTQL